MSAFAKLEALATYVTTVPLRRSSSFDTTPNGLSFFTSKENSNSWFSFFLVDVITWTGIVTPLMGAGAEDEVKSCKYIPQYPGTSGEPFQQIWVKRVLVFPCAADARGEKSLDFLFFLRKQRRNNHRLLIHSVGQYCKSDMWLCCCLLIKQYFNVYTELCSISGKPIFSIDNEFSCFIIGKHFICVSIGPYKQGSLFRTNQLYD